jgi:HPt (histidine-containing phosphotransfer) domain-containing protein
MTSHAMAGDKEKSFESGMNDHMTKPINPDRLFSTLLAWIKPGEQTIPYNILTKTRTKVPKVDTRLPKKVPGIEVNTGLVRAGGNQKLYLELLTKFDRDCADATSQIKNAFEGGEQELAKRLVHTVKGVSGNIGAHDLANAASELETAVREKTTNRFEEHLNQFDTELKLVLDSIRKVISLDYKQEEVQSNRPIADVAVLGTLLSKLMPYILDREAKPCKEIMKELTGYTWPDEYADRLKDLNRYVEKYKFKEGQKLLSQILEGLES